MFAHHAATMTERPKPLSMMCISAHNIAPQGASEALILVITMLRTYVSIGPGAPCTSRCWRRKWKAPHPIGPIGLTIGGASWSADALGFGLDMEASREEMLGKAQTHMEIRSLN